MNYEEFRERLTKSDWDAKMAFAILGLTGNVITKYIEERQPDFLSLETIRIRFPDLYEVLKDENSRNALVIIGLYDLHKGYCGEPILSYSARFIYEFPILPASECIFEGRDAIKAFLKSLYILFDEVRTTLLPVQRDVFRPKNGKEERAAKLEAIMREVLKELLKKRYPNEEDALLGSQVSKAIGNFVYNLFYYDYFLKMRGRLSKLLDEKL